MDLVAADDQALPSDLSAWQPGPFKRLPLLSLGSLLIAVGGIVAMTVILRLADGKPIDKFGIGSHRVNPTVLL